MATKKQAGSTKNVGDSQPKYLGVKLYDGQAAKTGGIIMKQRGTKILAGRNVGVGNDHTLFALKDGTVTFKEVRKKNFNGQVKKRKMAEVL